MRISFYGNGSAGNHGCEAIVRGTVAVLGANHSYTIQSDNPNEDTQYGLDDLTTIHSAQSPRKKDIRFLSAYLKLKMTGNFLDMDGLYYLPSIEFMRGRTDIALSVGGDNYCYGGTSIYAYLNKAYRKQGIKTVLWGCSIEPDVIKQPEVSKDLASYNLIVARESITYKALESIQKNLLLAPDPAFYMIPIPCAVDKRLDHDDVIGINISPHILTCETQSSITYENYKRLVSHILERTDATVALIPHVVWPSNDDRTVLRQLYDDFNHNERLILIEDHTAPELKYIISKCDFFVGARTHATIAAYSSYVPTLVVGYSVKARGIARDIFGTEDGYVLPVQELKHPDQLTIAFERLYHQRSKLRSYLIDKIPKYTNTQSVAVAALQKLANQ